MTVIALSSRSRPTGPGSRGGTIHLPGNAAAYGRAWRAANPEYRDREALRTARNRALAKGNDPALVTASASKRSRLTPSVNCSCDCGCREIVVTCGFCRGGFHL